MSSSGTEDAVENLGNAETPSCTSSPQPLPKQASTPCTTPQQSIPQPASTPRASLQQPQSQAASATSSTQSIGHDTWSTPSERSSAVATEILGSDDCTPDQWKGAKKCAGASLMVHSKAGRPLSKYKMTRNFVLRHEQRALGRGQAGSISRQAAVSRGTQAQKVQAQLASMERRSELRYQELKEGHDKLQQANQELKEEHDELRDTVDKQKKLVSKLCNERQHLFFDDTLPKTAFDAMRTAVLGEEFHRSSTSSFTTADDTREQRLESLRLLVNLGSPTPVLWNNDQLASHARVLTDYRNNHVCHQASTTTFDAKARLVLERIHELGVKACIEKAPFAVRVMRGYCHSRGIDVSSAAVASDDS